MAFPGVDEEGNGRSSDVHGLAKDPGDVRRIGARQPVHGHAIVQTKRVETKLKGAGMQSPMWTMMVGRS